MVASVFEIQKVPESDLARIPLATFLTRVFPQCSHEVVNYTTKIINNLKPLSRIGEHGDFVYVKKGALRRFFLGNGRLQDDFLATFEALSPDMIGDNLEVSEVVAENFHSPMDLDLRIQRRKNIYPNSAVSANLTTSLENLGFRKSDPHPENEFNNGQYNAKMKTIPIGIGTDRTKWALDIFEKGRGRAIFKIDLIDMPQTVEEWSADVTDTEYASDMDQILGLVTDRSGPLEVLYQNTLGIPEMSIKMFEQYLDGSSDVHAFSTDISKYLFQGVREIGQRAMFTLPLSTKYASWSMRNLIDYKVKNIGRIYPLEKIKRSWIKGQKEFLLANHKYLISCMLGMTSGNIAIGLPLFCLDQLSQLTPLGELIKTPEEFGRFMSRILKKFSLDLDSPLAQAAELYNKLVIERHNSQNLGAFLLVDTLKEMGKIPTHTPRTLASVASLLDPLLLL